MRAAAASLLLLCAAPAWAQAQRAPADLIAACSEQADGRSVGLQALEIECPGLEHALVELGYAPFLSEDQAAQLNIHALDDIAALNRRFAAGPPAAADLDPAALESILTQIERERSERPKSWLERAREWLRRVIERQQSRGDSWLDRWLQNSEVPTALTYAIGYGLIALVIVLAMAVLVSELRAAGVLQSRRRAARIGTALEASRPAEPQLTDLDTAPLQERPSILLRLLVAALSRSGRLRVHRNLTHRELAPHVAFEQASQRDRFAQVALLAERTLYGSGSTQPDEMNRVLREGRALHEELSSPRGAGG